jgi:kynurenine formamidase
MMRQADDAAGGLKPREAAFIDTGYWKHWGTESFFAAPYMTLDAAELLVDRGISLLVVDASTPDDTRASGRPVHEKILKEHSIPIIEGATNLDELPQRPFRFVALPLKLKGGSGSPIRLIGIVDR